MRFLVIFSVFVSNISFTAGAMDSNSNSLFKKKQGQPSFLTSIEEQSLKEENPKFQEKKTNTKANQRIFDQIDISGMSSEQKEILGNTTFAFNTISSVPQNFNPELISSNWLQSQESNVPENELPVLRSQTQAEQNSFMSVQNNQNPLQKSKEAGVQSFQDRQNKKFAARSQNPTNQTNTIDTNQLIMSLGVTSQDTIQERRSEHRSSTDSEPQEYFQSQEKKNFWLQSHNQEDLRSSTVSEIKTEDKKLFDKLNCFWKWAKMPFWIGVTTSIAYMGFYFLSPVVQDYTYHTLKDMLSSLVFKCDLTDASNMNQGIKMSINGAFYQCFLR